MSIDKVSACGLLLRLCSDGSRNFLKHGHRVEDCDMIVCWVHNWPECPLHVLELKEMIANRQSALRLGQSKNLGTEELTTDKEE
jgi:hypothetical protein